MSAERRVGAGDAPSPPGERRVRMWRIVRAAAPIVIPVVVVWAVWKGVGGIDLKETRAILENARGSWLAWSIGAAFCAVACMGTYDALAFPGRAGLGRGARWRIGTVVYAWTNFLTLGPLGGPALRLFLYRRAGMTTEEVLRGVGLVVVASSCGLASWVVVSMLPLGDGVWSAVWRVMAAVALSPVLAETAGRAAGALLPRRWTAPPRWVMARLGSVSVAEWGLSAVSFALAGRAVGVAAPLAESARAMLLGHAVGMMSMTPGGLGSADAVWVSLLAHAGVDEEVAAAQAVAFRITYYLTPWAGSLLALYAMFTRGRRWAAEWQRRIVAGAVALNAAILLLSAATPAVRGRLERVAEWTPVGVIEASHLAATGAAVVMLFLVRGLLRGYRSAMLITGVALGASALAHVFKGGDYEEAIASAVLLVLVFGARSAFRKAGRVPVGWELTLAVGFGAIAAYLIVGLASLQRWPSDPSRWLYVAPLAQGARFVRAAFVLAFVCGLFVLRQSLRSGEPRKRAGGGEVDRATAFIGAHGWRATALSVANGDKGVWWWEDRALAVYQMQGDRMIVLGDPVVARKGDESGALGALQEHATSEGVDLLFYQASAPWLEHLHEFGYSFFKLGEEAVVPLTGFSTDGGEWKQMRKSIRRAEGEGVRVEIVEPPHTHALLRALREVSDAWLAHKGGREMQFSVGHFSFEYLDRFPLGLARDGSGRVLAFVNLMPTRAGGPVTIDLMRRHPEAPEGTMEALLTECMRWGAARGHSAFELGVAPLADVGQQRSARLTERTARLMYAHGERVYGYRGLRSFKEKFRPVWEARYLAYPRPWDWAAAVASTTALVRAGSRADRRRIAQARGGGVDETESPHLPDVGGERGVEDRGA